MGHLWAAHRLGHAYSVAPGHSCLRKLLRCKRTKAFLTQDGTWTRDLQKAMRVSDRTEIEALCEHFTLVELEIYYSFGDNAKSEYDFVLPLR